MEAELAKLRQKLATAERERGSERTGRIRAEKALRDAQAVLQASAAVSSEAADVFPLVPIGVLHSCFSQRNGTPRQARAAVTCLSLAFSPRNSQPLLAPAARARLQLAPHVPPGALEGLADFSHVWLIYAFHANTNLGERLGAASRAHTATAKVHVPRLNGAKRGVLATRSPHRPTPVGLSLATVLRVCCESGVLELGGADLVDGTPVLDIKPFLPFCDAPAGAIAPPWAAAERSDGAEPLAVGDVVLPPVAAAALAGAWDAAQARLGVGLDGRRRSPLYPTATAFHELVLQVLSRDIRSAHQRERSCAAEPPGEAGAASDELPEGQPGRWRVVLDGVDVGYELLRDGSVVVTDARVAGVGGAAATAARTA